MALTSGLYGSILWSRTASKKRDAPEYIGLLAEEHETHQVQIGYSDDDPADDTTGSIAATPLNRTSNMHAADDKLHPGSTDSGAADGEVQTIPGGIRRHFSRQTYQGSLLFNAAAFLLPAMYGTLSKLWVANLDSSHVVTTDVYTYIGVIANVLNDGLPRAAWLIIGDKTTRTLNSRIGLAHSLILFQTLLGAIMTVVFVAASHRLASAFVPVQVRLTSLKYVKISSVLALSSAMEVAVSSCTRALDHPDVPLLISSTKLIINIVLDLLLISKVRVGSFTPTIITQALIRLSCDMTSAIVGLLYFLYISRKLQQPASSQDGSAKPSMAALRVLARPSVYTFIESALRNGLYLWLVSGIISMGETYATAWGVFNTIRWGLIMVPVQALEASSLTFVGHAWGRWRAQVGVELQNPRASRADLLRIVRPALISACIAVIVEVPLCIVLSITGLQGFAYYLSQSMPVAKITQQMWKTIDWCYIFYAVNYQFAAILLATSPRWFLYQALGSNILWILPWAIAVSRIGITEGTAWRYHSVIFGGALVFDFFDVSIVVLVWAWRLLQGKITVSPIQRYI